MGVGFTLSFRRISLKQILLHFKNEQKKATTQAEILMQRKKKKFLSRVKITL